MDWKRLIEDEFPAMRNGVHIKAAGGSPMCRSAYNEAHKYIEEMCFSGDLHFERYLSNLEAGRALIAKYLNVNALEIGFTVNSSTAAATVAEMLRRTGVERVYFPRHTFPTTIHALKNLGFELVPVGSLHDSVSLDVWQTAVDSGRRAAVVVSHVNFVTGQTCDLAGIGLFCREQAIPFVINATQSFGALKIDAGECCADMLYATGLKWAAAGYGAGFIHMSEDFIDRHGMPSGTGWRSVDQPDRMENLNTAARHCAAALDAGGGFPHFASLLALFGALKMYERIGDGNLQRGVSHVEERVLKLSNQLRKGLMEIGLSLLGDPKLRQQSGIVSVLHPEARKIFQRLWEDRIYSSCRRHPETDLDHVLRFGVHFYNTEDQVILVLERLQK
ncbi:MAG: aminotransferase class V-fold PLP-dependent enzyme [bacterium]|nr:aminotransferase class V-fold PLP-dependent enzyme [bacterium]